MGRQEERLRKLHDDYEKSKWYSEVARSWLDRWYNKNEYNRERKFEKESGQHFNKNTR